MSLSQISDIEIYIAPNIIHDNIISNPEMKNTHIHEQIRVYQAIRCKYSIDMEYFFSYVDDCGFVDQDFI